MAHYEAPLRDVRFVLHELLNVTDALRRMSRHAELDTGTLDQVLDAAGRFSATVLAPLNGVGDREGCRLAADGSVTTPAGFRDAYRQYVDAGWPALSCAPRYGGQGLPGFVNNALYEMLNAANQAWTMYAGLSHGAYECLLAHGADAQRDLYLPKLASGEWTGTMCMTEPQCGTDLGLVRTHAEPDGDGAWAISGTKIFISSGEHDLAANVVHLVLARTPDAPPGTRGLSLFVVPKFVPDADGRPGARNAVQCVALEQKMGIHGNATAELHFERARGWLVGELHRGLAAMFVMMNTARIGVGVQGLGLTELAYQHARAYARERMQMRALAGPRAPQQPADPLIVHPDVRRMLLTQKAWAEGGRAFAYWAALQLDMSVAHDDADVRAECADLAALLTPVVKAFLTDNAVEAANLAMQVYGGHGYIVDSGIEQIARDARIGPIYEGTNGIQALDLLGRKVLGDMGARLKRFGKLIATFVDEEGVKLDMQEFVNPLADLAAKVEKLTLEIGVKAARDPDEMGAAATPYLRTLGHLVFAYLWARMARVALDRIGSGAADEPFYRAKLATARFYFAKLLPETAATIRAARAGAAPLMDPDADWF